MIRLTFFTCVFLFLWVNAFGLNSSKPAIDHLIELNAEWQNHLELAPSDEICFQNEAHRIKYHLLLVEKYLRQNPAVICGPQLIRRNILLDSLHNYATRLRFPENSQHKTRTPYFIDDKGVHCAVGYLIKASGDKDLSHKISVEHNFSYIRDIDTEGIIQWANKHGFELAELAWIQPTYAPTNVFRQLGEGANDKVTVLKRDIPWQRLIVAGDFDTLD